MGNAVQSSSSHLFEISINAGLDQEGGGNVVIKTLGDAISQGSLIFIDRASAWLVLDEELEVLLDLHTCSTLIAVGLVNSSTLDNAFARLFRVRILLGMLDPPTLNPWNFIGNDSSTGTDTTEWFRINTSTVQQKMPPATKRLTLTPLHCTMGCVGHWAFSCVRF